MKMLESRTKAIGSEKAIRIGKAMREDRNNAGYSIRDLARKMGISTTHLNRIEKGERLMDSIEKLILFCDICRVPIAKYLILCGVNEKEGEAKWLK